MKLSIRYQILATVLGLVMSSVGAYLVYATEFIVRDKLAYAYDLNASLAHTRAQEIRSSIETLVGKLRFLAAAQYKANTSEIHDRTEPLFSAKSDITSLEIWERRGPRFVQTHHVTQPATLTKLNITPRDIARAHREAGLTPEVARAEKVLLRNTSLPPDIALVTVAVSSRDGRGVIIADVDPTQLVQLLGSSKAVPHDAH